MALTLPAGTGEPLGPQEGNDVLKQGRWISAMAAAVMLVTGVVQLVDGSGYGWLIIVGAVLTVIAVVLLAREQQRRDDR